MAEVHLIRGVYAICGAILAIFPLNYYLGFPSADRGSVFLPPGANYAAPLLGGLSAYFFLLEVCHVPVLVLEENKMRVSPTLLPWIERVVPYHAVDSVDRVIIKDTSVNAIKVRYDDKRWVYVQTLWADIPGDDVYTEIQRRCPSAH